MSAPFYNAFRFVHPDLDTAEGGAPQSPVRRSGLRLAPQGGVAMTAGDNSVRQAVLLLLSTRPGERVMRPDYGCNIHQLVFSPNDDTTAAIAIYHIRRALLQWEPRIDIRKLDARRDPENPSLLAITLEYQVRTTQAVEQLDLSFSLTGE